MLFVDTDAECMPSAGKEDATIARCPEASPPSNLSNTPLIEPAHRLFMGDDATSICVRKTLLNFLMDVDVVLNILERGAVREHLQDLLNLFFCRFHAVRILRCSDQILTLQGREIPSSIPT